MNPKLKNNREPDEYLKFEVLDRTHMIREHLSSALEDHPGLVNGRLKYKYKVVQDAIHALYEEAAKVSLK